MGPLSYMRSVVDRNVVTRRMTVLTKKTWIRCQQSQLPKYAQKQKGSEGRYNKEETKKSLWRRAREISTLKKEYKWRNKKKPNERNEEKNGRDKGRKAVKKKRTNVRMFSPVRQINSRGKFLRNISIYVPSYTASPTRKVFPVLLTVNRQ